MKHVIVLLILIASLLMAIFCETRQMADRMDEVLTNAAECGDIDCDDGYDYVVSRERLVRRLQSVQEVSDDTAAPDV